MGAEDMVDTAVDTMVAKRETLMLLPLLMLTPMPMLHLTIMVDTMAEDMDMEDTVVMDIPMVDMVDTDTTVANDLPMPKPNPTTDMVDITAEDTDTEDTEVMVDT